MRFDNFLDIIPKLTKIPLPGSQAHNLMAPLGRNTEFREKMAYKENPRQAAVLALFYPDLAGDTKLVCILRKTYKGVHSNQVGFPGGKVEPEDHTLDDTAVRETEEEIGVFRKDIHVHKELTNVYIPPSNFWVQPFIGHIDYTPEFIKQESEVEELIEISIDDLLSDKHVTTQKITTSYAVDIDVPAFLLNNYVVWGATAMILSEIKSVLKIVV